MTSDCVIVSIKEYLGVGNDEQIILRNVGSHIMSGLEVIEEGGGLRRPRLFGSQEANKKPV